MPDRSRNRPRIAGRRRTPLAAVPEVTTNDTPEAGVVTPATLEAPETPAEAFLLPGTITESDESAAVAGPPAHGKTARPRGAAEADRGSADGRLGVMLPAALGVLIVLVLTFAVVLGIKAWKRKESEDARDQAAAAGRKAAETALSYDYRDLDKSFAAARATMTPEFAAKFDDTARVAGELASKTKATVKADVREVGVRDGDANRVTLIIFVNQTTTSTITQGKPRVDLNRTRFTMVRNGGQWLVQEIAGL